MLRALKVIGLGTLIWLFTFLTIIVWTMGYAIYKTMSVASPDRANVDIRTGLGGPAIALACAADRRKRLPVGAPEGLCSQSRNGCGGQI